MKGTVGVGVNQKGVAGVMSNSRGWTCHGQVDYIEEEDSSVHVGVAM